MVQRQAVDLLGFLVAAQVEQGLALGLQGGHGPAALARQQLVARHHRPGQVVLGQALADGHHGLPLFELGLEPVFDVAGRDGFEQVGVRMVLGRGRHLGIGALGRHHEEETVGRQQFLVAQVLEPLLAIRFAVEVEVAEDQVVAAAAQQAHRVLGVRRSVRLADTDLAELTTQGGLLCGHVVDDQRGQVGVGGHDGHGLSLVCFGRAQPTLPQGGKPARLPRSVFRHGETELEGRENRPLGTVA